MEFVSWDEYSIPNFSWKVMKNSMVPVTTNQFYFGVQKMRLFSKCVGLWDDFLVRWQGVSPFLVHISAASFVTCMTGMTFRHIIKERAVLISSPKT